MRKIKKRVVASLLVSSIALGTISTTVFAGSGNINVMNMLDIPFSFYINENNTIQETMVGQNVKSTSNFGDKEKIRQAVVNAPSEGGKFNFNATFYIQQSKSFFGRRIWDVLSKTLNRNVLALNPDFESSKTPSYIDLVVKIDERITPAETISAYFDSHTWRPTFIFDKDKNVLGDARNTLVSGQSRKNFTFSSNGKTEYIIRVVPMDVRADGKLDAPMTLGFDTPDNSNFTISSETANEIARKRREMTEADVNREKALLNKSLTKEGLTEEEIRDLKKFNTYTYGNIEGQVTAALSFFSHTEKVNGQIPPAGIVATYENPKVTFYRNEDTTSEETSKSVKVGNSVFVEYNNNIKEDALTDFSMPEDPTREGYTFAGWSTDRNATEGTTSEEVSLLNITDDVEYFAIWKPVSKQTVTHRFESGTQGKDLPQGLLDRVNGKDLTEQAVDTTVSPNSTIDFSEYTDEDNDGVWRFASWKTDTLAVVDNSENNIQDANTFVGTWNFTPNKYGVTYIFQPILTTEDLPQEVTNLLPTDSNQYAKDTVVNIAENNKTFSDVPVDGGKWVFEDWNYDSLTVTKETNQNVFVGNWKFVPKTFDVVHEFESGTQGKNLPQEISDRVNGKTLTGQVVGATVSPNNTIELTPYTDETNDGVWTFKGWNDENLEVVDTDKEKVPDANTFIGTWEFTANKYRVSYEFVSNVSTKELPQEVKNLLPTDDNEYVKYTVVNIDENNKTFSDVDVEGGKWVFLGWNSKDYSLTVNNGSDNKFVGTWNFVKKGKLNFKFQSGLTNITELPQEVIALTPNPVDVSIGDNVKDKLVQPTKTEVIANAKTDSGEIPGKWVFREYVNTDREIVSTPDTVIGKWDFYAIYNVNHRFESGTPNKELPQEVIAKLPTPATITKYSGERVESSNPLSNSVTVEEGTWEFKGWRYNNTLLVNQIVESVNGNVEFVGIWEFTEKTSEKPQPQPVNYTLTFEFVSGTAEKELPEVIRTKTPANETVLENTNYVVDKTFEDVEVENGTWKFKLWNPTKKVITENTKFVGTWEFEEKTTPDTNNPIEKYKISYKFVSPNSKKLSNKVLEKLPAEQTFDKGKVVSPKPDNFNPIYEDGGRWTFKGWKDKSYTVNGDFVFVGTWLFEKNLVHELPEGKAPETPIIPTPIIPTPIIPTPQPQSEPTPQPQPEPNKPVVEEVVEEEVKPNKPNKTNNETRPSGKVLPKTNIASTSIATAIMSLAGVVLFKRKRK